MNEYISSGAGHEVLGKAIKGSNTFQAIFKKHCQTALQAASQAENGAHCSTCDREILEREDLLRLVQENVIHSNVHFSDAWKY